jgi:hypothetical protein
MTLQKPHFKTEKDRHRNRKKTEMTYKAPVIEQYKRYIIFSWFEGNDNLAPFDCVMDHMDDLKMAEAALMNTKNYYKRPCCIFDRAVGIILKETE